MKRQSLHVKDNAIYDQFTKQQVIWTHGYGATYRYVTRNEWGSLLLQWPVLHWTLPARHFYAVVRYQTTEAWSHVLPSSNFNTYLSFRGIRGWRNHCSTVSIVSTACSTVCRIISIVSPDTYTSLIPDIFRREGSRGHGPSLGGPGALDRASSGPFGTRDKTACALQN